MFTFPIAHWSASGDLIDLLNGLVAYWKLDETSGTRVDSHGNNDLTDNNTVTSAAGLINNAASFSASNSEFLSIADNPDVSTGDIDFLWALWVQIANKSATRVLISKGIASFDALEYYLIYDDGADRYIFTVSNGSSHATIAANNFGSPPINTWALIIVWHDSVNDTISIQVNDGTPNSTAWAGGGSNNAQQLNIGCLTESLFFWDGLIDEMAFAKRKWTAAERTAYYNGGAGLAYPFS